MRMKLDLFIIGILLSINTFADGYYPAPTSLDQPWSLTVSGGKGKYQNNFYKDGETVFGRLALDNELILAGDFALGLELGVQNGNDMRLHIPYTTLVALEWLPIQTTLGPMIDLLVTAKSDPLIGSAFFAQLKGGLAYRHWRIKQYEVNDLSKLSGEVQAGLGYPITALASLSLLYQGVFGDTPEIKANFVSKTARVASIPTLHAILLGFSVNL